MEPLTSKSFLERALGWLGDLLPWGLGGVAVAAVASQFGDMDKLLEKLPTPIRSFIDWICEGFNSVMSYGKETVRGFIDKESSTAQRDYVSAIDSFDAINRVDKTFGLNGASAHIRELAKKASGDIFGISMTRDHKVALESSTKLHEDITNYLVERLKEKKSNYTASDVEKFTEAASNAASYITGITSETGDNPNLLTQGLGGALVRLQTEVKKEGDYRTGQTPAGTVDESLIARAREIFASVNISGGNAPASAPAQPSTARGR